MDLFKTFFVRVTRLHLRQYLYIPVFPRHCIKETMASEQLLTELLLPAVLGGIGGLTRGVIGLLKALSLRRRIIWSYYFITVVVAAVIGVFVGIIFNFDYRLSLLAGYAGTDILEGIYKSFKVEKTYVIKGKGK